MQDYEKLGVFYLGRRFDAATGRAVADEPILYDAKDLTTHAVIVGMTGSGKTGLAVALLEEAAIDGIPVIAIDPKGDLGNLLLAFPELSPAEFRPWIDEAEAARQGRTPDAQAAATAELWRKGLAEWDESPARIARYAAAAERVIYTPGSQAGRPLAALRSFAAPAAAVAADPEALRDRVAAAAASLLGLVGVDADPLKSREHILLSTLLERAWREGRDLDLPGLIQQVQKPPVERVGVMELEAFFPAKERFTFALALNNLAASPSFAVWTAGEPLDAARLLYTPEGRPRLSVVSIAHLSDAERMFVVTLLLSEVLAWVRSQPGSSSLRAILYMDEVFGFFPPVANPPSKVPMLTLLKQARAFGLGVVLATQNPVDLDYKGLANAGTWFLGRLQTERDKARVLEGLEGASAGARFDRARVEATLAGLTSRVFLMSNAHEDAPVLMQTRWALSYLAGPMTREQIRRLTPSPTATPNQDSRLEAGLAKRAIAEGTQASAASAQRAEGERSHQDAVLLSNQPQPLSTASSPLSTTRPLVPAGVPERFLPVATALGAGEKLVYRPALLGVAALHYVQAKAKLDEWVNGAWLAPLTAESASAPWEGAAEMGRAAPELAAEPVAGAEFAPLPAGAGRAESFERWGKMLAAWLVRARPLELLRCADPERLSRPGESEGEFRARLRDALREARDASVEKLRKKYAPEVARLEDQIARAEHRVEVEREQYSAKKTESMISIGASVVGALFGRKLASRTNVGRAATAMRGLGHAADERGDIGRAEERALQTRARLAELEQRLEADLAALRTGGDPSTVAFEELAVPPRKSDVDVQPLVLVWTPWRVDPQGIATPAWT